MARFLLLVLMAALPLGTAKSEPSATPAATPSDSPRRDDACPQWDGPKKGDESCKGDDDDSPMKRFRKRLEQMDPKEREHFRENLERWKAMGDKERMDWKRRAAAEQDRLRKSVDDAIEKTGLTLTPDQREVFTLRYRQERRKIEEQLCKEIDVKRKAKVAEMLTQLKAEFTKPAPVATPSPSPTP
ncbi:MAG TPA: hypothetical protein VIM61_13800 [Chthoniobacterales bacterium]